MAIYSHRSARRKIRAAANLCGGKSCPQSSSRHRHPVQSNRACVIINLGGIIIRRQTAGEKSGHSYRLCHCQPRHSQSVPSRPAETSSGGKHSRREIRSLRITALQSTAAEISRASRNSCLICVKTSLPYHSPGVTVSRGESVGIIIFVSSPFSVYIVLVRLSPYMILVGTAAALTTVTF